MDLTGRTLGHYRVLEEISRGGMGIVYRATDTRLNRDVALKVLPEDLTHDADRRRRFLQEAHAASALEHPHIAVIHEADEADGVAYIAMELIRGEKLSDVLSRQRPTPARSLEIGAEVAAGLARAHEKGIVHRDLKPANVMLTDEGHAKIIDFGIAKLIESTAGAGAPTQTSHDTGAGVVLGTMTYMSPEQACGDQLDHRSDIFSFGILLHEMLAGQPPFRGKTGIETASAILHEPAPRLPSLGPAAIADAGQEIQRIVDKCLAKDPADRYQGMKDVVVDLRAARRRMDTGPHTAAVAARPAPVALWGWAATALVVIAIAGAVILTSNREPVSVAETGGSSRPSVAVLYFDNTTGDQSLDWMRTGITEMVVTDLSQAGDIEVVSTDRLYGILAELKRQDDRVLSPEVVSAVAERTGVDRVLVGSYVKAGEAIRINVRLQDAKTGRIESSERVEGPGTSALFGMVDDLSRRIRAKFDGLRADASLLTPPGGAPPPLDRGIGDVTTPSIEAYRLYADGISFHNRLREREALELFERAVAIDPTFATAYSKMSVVESNLGHADLRAKYAALALKFSDRATPRERAYIEGWFYAGRVATRANAITAYERCLSIDPAHEACQNNLALLYNNVERHADAAKHYGTLVARGSTIPQAHGNLSWAYNALGDPEKGRTITSSFVKQHPESGAGHRNLAMSLNALGRHDEAVVAYEQSRLLNPGDSTTDMALAVTHLLREDWTSVARMVEPMLVSKDETRQWQGAMTAAAVHLFHGRSVEGIKWSDRAAAAYRTPGLRTGNAMRLKVAALAARGDTRGAISATERAVTAAKDTDEEARARVMLAWLLAVAGRHEASNAEIATLIASIQPVAKARDSRNAAFAQGLVALALHDSKAAISSLTEAQAGLSPKAPSHLHLPWHIPIWSAMGQALLEAGRPSDALPWFRKVAESVNEHAFEPIDYVRSFYFLGRIYEQQGDLTKARESYQRFVNYWKDGDLDRDRVAEARRKIAS